MVEECASNRPLLDFGDVSNVRVKRIKEMYERANLRKLVGV